MNEKARTRREFLRGTLGATAAFSVVLLDPPDLLTADRPSVHSKAIQPPILHQEQRSDWLNVKDCGAKGNGQADDTEAIQSAYSRIGQPNQPKVVYFPPGTYRITKTLTVTGNLNGLAFIGHGRESIITWDGERGGSMYWSNGVHRSRYEGLTYDGRGKAGIGSEHRSMTAYETAVIYESCAFLDMDFGIAVTKKKSRSPSAEIWYHNCLFKNTGTGLYLGEFNDYDNWIHACVFIGNDIGVDSRRGHFNVWNSHFIDSRTVDVRQGQAVHPSSIRWSTSHGSARFFETGPGRHNYPFTLQDNWVEGWTAADGAVRLALRGPTLIMDNTFSNPPNTSPPILLANKRSINPWTEAQVVLSGNSPAKVEKLMDPGLFSRCTSIPTGSNQRILHTGTEWFYQNVLPPRGRVFDAKRDFGATGDRSTDDTAAIQKTIDAARQHGKGAVAYLPTGTYLITKTLEVTGADYTIESTGYASALEWKGTPQGPIIAVYNPYSVTIAHLSCKGPETATFIRQTGDEIASSVYYNNLHLMGPYTAITGLELFELSSSSVVRIGFLSGCLRVVDSGQATILGTIKLGRTVIEGYRLPKSGFMGLLYQNDVNRDFALSVKDNQDIVVGDFYSEQNQRYLLCEGGSRKGPGSVTIGGSKMESLIPEEQVVIRNYEGRICITTAGIQKGPSDQPFTFVQTGTRPVDFILMASAFLQNPLDPIFRLGRSCRFIGIENASFSNNQLQRAKSLPNEIPQGGLESAGKALDDFRRLGQVNNRVNYADKR